MACLGLLHQATGEFGHQSAIGAALPLATSLHRTCDRFNSGECIDHVSVFNEVTQPGRLLLVAARFHRVGYAHREAFCNQKDPNEVSQK
jgi:hypothetical protein